jgi:hypothetical protein
VRMLVRVAEGFEGGTYRVRITSIGARINPAIPAAATAIPILAKGFELSSIFVLPPANDVPTPAREGSGKFSSAESRLRDHVSIVLRSTLYTKVLFVPFQIPHAPSFDHN